MKKKHILYFLITLIIAVIAFAAGHITGKIRVQKVPEEDSYIISEVSEEDSGSSYISGEVPDEDLTDIPDNSSQITCRIITMEEDMALLAEIGDSTHDGRLFYQSFEDLPITFEDPEVCELQAGMKIQIAWNGTVSESYPALLGEIYGITVPKDGMDTLCIQYLRILNELWEEDPALNSGITMLGMDLSQTRLSMAERSGIAWAFSQQHNLSLIEGTFEELVQQGYIDGENLYWEDGCLFSIRETNVENDQVTFDAEKWRSGLGALFYTDCKSTRSADGIWTDYEIGGYAIS